MNKFRITDRGAERRGSERVREKQGIRTHVLLVVAMAVIIAVVTGLSLLLIRHHLRNDR